MDRKKSTVVRTKVSVSNGNRLEKRKAVAPSSNERPPKWTRGGQGKKIKGGGKAEEDGKAEEYGKLKRIKTFWEVEDVRKTKQGLKTKQDGKVGQPLRYPVRAMC